MQSKSSEVTERPVTQTHSEESDADRGPRCSDHYQNQKGLTCLDAQHWQGACRLPDCRLGLLEGKVASSCCRSGLWRKSFEEPPSRSNSMTVTLRRHESVAMLPHLLSTLSVTRTRSEPCIFGKDFLRITLPLPGEPNECEANASSTDHHESITSTKVLSDAAPLTVWEMGGSSSFASVFTCLTSGGEVYDETMTDTDASSRTPCLWDGFDIAGPVPDVIEVSNVQASNMSIMRPRENFHGADSSSVETEQAWNLGDQADGSVVVGSPASKTPHWDDWWTFHPEDFCVANECTDQQRVQQHREKSKGVSCNPAVVDDVDEDALDEGYLVLEDEQEEEQLGSGNENETYCNADKEGNSEHVYCDSYDSASGESRTEWQLSNSKAYKEDDIWSDEHFVSSQAKGFPPPISILANETHPGLPSHVPKTLWRSVKRNGRFVLQEVQARPREFFQATRECGRLRLQLVRPDSDSNGSFTETASIEDKEGSLISSESIGNFTGIAEICQQDDFEIRTPEAGPSNALVIKTSSQGVKAFEIVNEKPRGPGYGESFLNTSQGLMLSSLLSDEQGSRSREELSGSNDGQRKRASADTMREKFIDQGDSNVVGEGPCVTDRRVMTEGTPGEKIHDEGFKRTSDRDIMAPETRELDICDHAIGMSACVHGTEEQYRHDYQHPHFSATYGFDKNLNVLSPTQAVIMQFPIQPAVR